MPTYQDGYEDGFERGYRLALQDTKEKNIRYSDPERFLKVGRTFNKPKRKLSAWNKFVKANSNKKKFQYASGKLKLKKMGIAYRKKRR